MFSPLQCNKKDVNCLLVHDFGQFFLPKKAVETGLNIKIMFLIITEQNNNKKNIAVPLPVLLSSILLPRFSTLLDLSLILLLS